MHGDAIRTKAEIADSTLNVLTLRVVKMAVYDLLRESEGAVEATANNLQVAKWHIVEMTKSVEF